jgi:4-amino-4-deoxy-L-arabinose transferase-like glycosyltransferase
VRNLSVQPDRLARIAWLAVAVAVFGIALAVRIRLLTMPLERDEGEYAYAGQLMLEGFAPYKLVYNMKFPGTYAAYALIMSIFGQTITAIHVGLLIVNAGTVCLIFLLGRRLLDSIAGLSAAASYAVLSLSPSVLGLAAHATHFVVLPVAAGTLLLLNRSERRVLARLFLSGLLFGFAILMKQPAIFFALFAVTCLLFRRSGRRHFKQLAAWILVFSAAVIAPIALTCALFWSLGVFDKFWVWTIQYGREYATLVPLSQVGHVFTNAIAPIIGAAWPLWALAVIGLFSGLWNARVRGTTIFVLWLLVCSFLALSSGFYFRPHYFILLLPALSLLIGITSSTLSRVGDSKMLWPIPLLLCVVGFGVALFSESKPLFQDSPVEACGTIYPSSPFPESIRIAQYLREHAEPSDTIAVLGSEPQIYFYAKRHSATGYIYMYGLMEVQKYAREMQAEMEREIEAARPKYLLSVVMQDSWLARPESDRQIFAWANEYTGENYEVVGFVNLVAPGRSDYYFDEIPASVPQLGQYILIYKRKS